MTNSLKITINVESISVVHMGNREAIPEVMHITHESSTRIIYLFKY